MKIYRFKGKAIILLMLLFSFSSAIVLGQQTYPIKKGVIYIVRHAEKDSGNDPSLSVQGYIRSGDLQRFFKASNNKLDRVYVNQFRRTQLTADSIRLIDKVDTVHYVADNNGDGLIKALTKYKNKDKRILIVAHSNTIPVILKRLGIVNFPSVNIPDNEYDNLYTVTFHKGRAFLFTRKFGKPSSATATGSLKTMLQ